MRLLIKTFLLSLCLVTNVYAQKEYNLAFDKLTTILNADTINGFKKAVFITENAFDSKIEYNDFQNEIAFLLNIANIREKTDSLIYKGKDIGNIRKYASIFKAITDTTRLLLSGEKYEHKPFRYDFDDVFGGKSWKNYVGRNEVNL